MAGNVVAILYAPKEVEINTKTDLVSYYKKLQGEKEAMIERLDDGTLKGSEGSVWYLHTDDADDGVIQYKMKPESVEQIHWKEGLGKNIILATIMNCFESFDVVDYEAVKELLLEEFLGKDIEAKKDLILQCIREIEGQIVFKERVLAVYDECKLDIISDKVNTMRILSQRFSKDLMRKVYAIVIEGRGGRK